MKNPSQVPQECKTPPPGLDPKVRPPPHPTWYLLQWEAEPTCWYGTEAGVTTLALPSRPIFMESGEVGMISFLVCGQVQDFSRGRQCSSQEQGLWTHTGWVPVLALPVTSCTSLSKWLNLPEA